jgi:hypothetical protein
MINKFARSLKIWCISLECHVGKGTERMWWFMRPGEDRFTQRNLTDEQAVMWLQEYSLEKLV